MLTCVISWVSHNCF